MRFDDGVDTSVARMERLDQALYRSSVGDIEGRRSARPAFALISTATVCAAARFTSATIASPPSRAIASAKMPAQQASAASHNDYFVVQHAVSCVSGRRA
jgi:hypothetical protein